MKNNLLFIVLSITFAHSQAQTPSMKDPLPCKFIYQLDVNGLSKKPGQKGPQLLKYALVETCLPEDDPEPQMMVLPVEWRGVKSYRHLVSIIKAFETEEDAHAFAEMNHVPMAWFKNDKERVEYVIGLRENGKLPQDLRDDWVLQYIETQLPPDWELVQTVADSHRTFTIQAKYTALQTRHNLINAPMTAIQDHGDTAFMKKNGQEIRPFFRFELHQPWRDIELRNIDYAHHGHQFYFANGQYFGLKVFDIKGLGGPMEQVLLPKDVEGTPNEVFQLVKGILTPKEFTGTAENAKMGAAILAADGTFYLIDDRKGDWYNWKPNLCGKQVTVSGIKIPRTQDEPLVNDKGEYMGGALGGINYIVNAKLVKSE